MPEHTTGPLRVLKGCKSDDARYVFGPMGQVAIVNGYAKPGDAHLFAAAPEMYVALVECAVMIAQTHNRKLTADEQAALDNARRVIARAEGRL